MVIIKVKIILTYKIMETKDKNYIEANNILEMVYSLYMKDLQAGNIKKDSILKSFGKIIKKKVQRKDEPNLFSY